MSAEEFLIKKINHVNQIVAMQMYANYVTQWHLNNAKEFVADGVNCKQSWFGPTTEIDKQSINTAIDNYIEINLNKEL